jgi:hypothetical protein
MSLKDPTLPTLAANVDARLTALESGGGGGGPHTHEQTDVVGLVDALAAKAADGHNHDAAYDALGAAAAALSSALAADFSGAYSDLTGKPTLFSGSYTDLTDKPTLGDAAAKNVGTAAGTVAAGDHTHAGGGSAPEYPVGWLLFSEVNVNPATFLGYGTWASYGAGRVLVGLDASDTDFDTAGGTGGAKTSSAVVNHTHAVSVTDPGHAHVENSNNATTGGLRGWGAADTSTNTSTATGYSTASATTGITATTENPAGGAASFSLMNPYIVVYMWKRTA